MYFDFLKDEFVKTGDFARCERHTVDAVDRIVVAASDSRAKSMSTGAVAAVAGSAGADRILSTADDQSKVAAGTNTNGAPKDAFIELFTHDLVKRFQADEVLKNADDHRAPVANDVDCHVLPVTCADQVTLAHWSARASTTTTRPTALTSPFNVVVTP